MFDIDALGKGETKFMGLGSQAEEGAGKLTLHIIRQLQPIVEQRARDDAKIHYLDGREMHGAIARQELTACPPEILRRFIPKQDSGKQPQCWTPDRGTAAVNSRSTCRRLNLRIGVEKLPLIDRLDSSDIVHVNGQLRGLGAIGTGDVRRLAKTCSSIFAMLVRKQ